MISMNFRPKINRCLSRRAKLAGDASRQFAAAAEAKGVSELAQSGMQVIKDVDRNKFAAEMASANPNFDRLFGSKLISKIREYK